MNNRETVLFYSIALTQIKGLGRISIRQILEKGISAQELFGAVAGHDCEATSVLGRYPIECIRKNMDTAFRIAEAEMKLIEKHQIRTFIWGEEEYPYRLKECPDAPLVLYAMGTYPLNSPRMLAVVGSRKATCYGLSQTEKLIRGVAAVKPCIVSGMAYGIDACAHKAALDCELPTVAVLGNGLGTVYPYSNRKLFGQIMENGLLITEFLYNDTPETYHFPLRNRIIAGVSDAVAVMEAKQRSGALITADLAFSYNREVFAYPGRITDEMSEGCNHLIAQNKAVLVTTPQDLVEGMGWNDGQLQLFPSMKPALEMSGDEQKLYGLIQYLVHPDIDSLVENSSFSIPTITYLLLSMECKGLIKSMSGNRYCCI